MDVDEEIETQESYDPMDTKRGEIFELLRRFKLVQMVRHSYNDFKIWFELTEFVGLLKAKMCYDHIDKTKPQFGNINESYRRSLLLKKVSSAQKEEFKEVFRLIDQNEDGTIQEAELLRVVNSLVTDDNSIIQASGKSDQTLTFDEFMAIMAEAEFYNLFLNTFNSLDVYNSGFVRAKDLKKILSGINDLISDEQISIIGGKEEDEDFLVNYEQFTKMLLGTKL